jgi:uracil phosphoribosyltransferase
VNAGRAAGLGRAQAFVAVEYFFKSPSDLHERLVIVISPVLATANTAVAAVDRLKERGATFVDFGETGDRLGRVGEGFGGDPLRR